MKFAFRRDVALGRYLPLDTPVHALDPRTKLFAFAVIVIVLFQVGALGAAILVLALAGLTSVARIPGRRTASLLRGLRWILILTFLFHAFWLGSADGGLAAGAVQGLAMVLRLVGMMLAAALLTFTTEPIRLASGLARAFGFLTKLRVPVRELSLVLTLALRFLPTVLEEAERIVVAQRARGARFGGGPIARARSLLPLAVPLFAGCLHRADTLALAMDARGYRSGAPRTELDPLSFARRDAVVIVLFVLVAAASFLAPGSPFAWGS